MSLTEGMSPKQRQLFWLESHDYKVVAAHGTVRSGKTFSGIGGLMNYVGRHFSEKDILLSAKSQKQLDAIVLKEAKRWSRVMNCGFVKRDSYYMTRAQNGGRNYWYTALGNDSASVDKIQGMTLAGAYCDEVTTLHPEFVVEIDFRCSVPGAKIVHTMNPEGTKHWYKTQYLDPGAALEFAFAFDDNPSLTAGYIADLKARYPSGTIARRKLQGEWCDESGNVWDITASTRPRPASPPAALEVSIDTASASVTHALLIGVWAEGAWVIGEWRHDGREDGRMSHAQQVAEIGSLFDLEGKSGRWIVDQTSADFKLNVSNAGRKCIGSQSDVLAGIQTVAWMLQRGRLYVDPCAQALIADIGGYQWDPKAAERGEDKPLKKNDHGCDALRYWCVDYMMRRRKAAVKPVIRRGR